jgi:hypothetical protein
MRSLVTHPDRGVNPWRSGWEAHRVTSLKMSVPDGMVGIVRENQAGTCTTQHGTAAGHAVAARRGDGVARPMNREPTARPLVAAEILVFTTMEDAKCNRSPSRSRRRGCGTACELELRGPAALAPTSWRHEYFSRLLLRCGVCLAWCRTGWSCALLRIVQPLATRLGPCALRTSVHI